MVAVIIRPGAVVVLQVAIGTVLAWLCGTMSG